MPDPETPEAAAERILGLDPDTGHDWRDVAVRLMAKIDRDAQETRDYFAGQALAGNMIDISNHTPAEAATECYKIADLMMTAREKK